jgi:hypothetical protein
MRGGIPPPKYTPPYAITFKAILSVSESRIEINVSTVASQIEHVLSLLIAALTIVGVGSYHDMDWDDLQVLNELERQRRHYKIELRVNLRVAALNTIEEIQNLRKSLNQSITEWKVDNL